eukprot:TRINITY_DN7786_c0_g2_i2.p1 TRINITY_DN7786_c0_g2~~TRINITY_DN7786_c0_g2_i2.p1  ORF type:complete len:130 (-),score=17.14 TRINITY_DN7786_c0_g2_i2:138-527(-)
MVVPGYADTLPVDHAKITDENISYIAQVSRLESNLIQPKMIRFLPVCNLWAHLESNFKIKICRPYKYRRGREYIMKLQHMMRVRQKMSKMKTERYSGVGWKATRTHITRKTPMNSTQHKHRKDTLDKFF